MTLIVFVFKECNSDAFFNANASHCVVAYVVVLELASVMMTRPEDSSVANKALVVFEKKNARSVIRCKDNV